MSTVPWATAKAKCEEMGGQLVCVESASEWRFVEKLADGRNIWLGAQAPKDVDISDKKRMKWVNGKPFSPFKGVWENGHPWHFAHIKTVATINAEWVTISGSDARITAYVCEWE